tara:strand:+ start:35 stop:1168 length:1134 start_codon:yes stop_codon:yes gene_type:complete
VGIEHDVMVREVSAALLSQLRTNQAGDWATARLTDKSTLWQGTADWPRPDIAFEAPDTGATLALEFKPPNCTKREYVTGLGQMLTYLADFEFSGLVLPECSSDGFKIADYVVEVINRDLNKLPLMVLSYGTDAADFSVLRKLTVRKGAKPPKKSTQKLRTFWGYWRDLSNYDLYEILRIIDVHPGNKFDASFKIFWNKFTVKKKARKWDGNFRKVSASGNIAAEQINAFLSMRHSGLIDPNGQLTISGLKLLQTGKVYGPEGSAFLSLLAHFVLTNGRHLELILWVEDQTRKLTLKSKSTAPVYLTALDKELVAAGVISPRPKNAVKANFIRDEPKLWNKLGLLDKRSSNQYFHPNAGYQFDWAKIISIVGCDENGK